MIYLDYAATHPVLPSVKKAFLKASKNFANANSIHKSGQKVLRSLIKAENRMKTYLGLPSSYELIFTSGATEANNLLIHGLTQKHPKRKHIISTPFEHSSMVALFNHLGKLGYQIDILPLNEAGELDLTVFKTILREDTLLVSIVSVCSELGSRLPLAEISAILKDYPQVYFHSDVTQSLFKEPLNLEILDFATFSGHKFGAIKGIGALIKKKNEALDKWLLGGHSLHDLRPGTPSNELILSLAKAMEENFLNFEEHYYKVKQVNEYCVNKLIKFKDVILNSPPSGLPHILNFSLKKPFKIDLIKYFSSLDICLGAISACESHFRKSLLLFRMTSDELRASQSLRLSFSFETTFLEIDQFIEVLTELLK